MGVRRQPDGMSEANLQGPATARASLVAPVKVVGTQPRPVFGNIDYQSVIKRTVETKSKKVHVSTPMLKLHLIINDLRNPPWPHPASSTSSSRQLHVIVPPAPRHRPASSPSALNQRANRHPPPHRPLINSATIRTLSLNAVGCPGTVMKR